MMYVMMGVATVMSFIAGVECVVLVVRKNKNRRLKYKCEALEAANASLRWELEKQMMHKEVVKEVAE